MTTAKGHAMSTGATELTVFGAVIGWVFTVFGFGRAYGVLRTRVDAAETDIKELNVSMAKLLRCFVDANGEPRLVSYPALDQIRRSCRESLDVQIANHTKTIEKHDLKLDTIIKGVAEIAALAKTKKNGNGSE